MNVNEHQISFDEIGLEFIPTPMSKIISSTYSNRHIQEAFVKHWNKFAYGEYERIMVSVSGGADSDRMIDFIERIGYPAGTVTYTFFNTGVEYEATKKHLDYLENKYGIEIKRYKANMPVGMACKKYGYPFLSKQVSEFIHRLQEHGFEWEDKPLDELIEKYPGCKAALRWWCNDWGENSKCNISRRKYLKEFMIANPPTFKISPMCCQKSKKDTAHAIEKELSPDLSVVGVRKAEGGARATAYKSCFDSVNFGCDKLRPLFWPEKEDCEVYDQIFNIQHSDCYEKYGLKRTGCACCPFGRDYETELEAANKYEPVLFRAANLIFAPTYEYTRMYKDFVRKMEVS